jgi:hypothetical protein
VVQDSVFYRKGIETGFDFFALEHEREKVMGYGWCNVMLYQKAFQVFLDGLLAKVTDSFIRGGMAVCKEKFGGSKIIIGDFEPLAEFFLFIHRALPPGLRLLFQ